MNTRIIDMWSEKIKNDLPHVRFVLRMGGIVGTEAERIVKFYQENPEKLNEFYKNHPNYEENNSSL